MEDNSGHDDSTARVNDSSIAGGISRRLLMKGAAALGAGSLVSTSSVSAAEEGQQEESTLAEAPPMGWNSWNTFACDVSAALIKETADAIVESGMKAAGYEYVNIDDCWMTEERDEDGNLQPDPEKFPNGIDAVADYVHDRGLKLGIYESAGTTTCGGYPGSLGHEERDAQAFADWGVDYLKYDNCGDHYGLSAVERYTRMHEALEATDREIVLSICEWGNNDPWLWGHEVGGSLWRTTGDIKPLWTVDEDTWYHGVIDIVDMNEPLAAHAGPDHWNDPDMLEVGVDIDGYPGLTATEDRTHFGLWAMMAAPLIAGNDVRNMSEQTREILTNEAVIAIDQDPAGKQGRRIKNTDGADGTEVWMKPLANGDRAVALLNRGERTRPILTSAREVGFDVESAYIARDLWAGTVTATAGMIGASVPAHGHKLYRVERGQSDDAVPAALLSINTDEPTVVPGEARDLTVTFTNHAPSALETVSVTLDAPDGWESEPATATFHDVAAAPSIEGASGPENDAEVDWMVRPPQGIGSGEYELAVSAEFAGRPVSTTVDLTVDAA
ncbi:NEW3 domain-containing protein [Halocatena salina]|uniref:alpha-galactosidase n=1 Tax=Halocatena salina TaxID=2934340 RepID=A0A8U0A525_9EURY|nr:NEW3 domain-containing protein [Halocatena salina]UPM44192.1 NEW3 domain-containing protein [Halocatena salina]